MSKSKTKKMDPLLVSKQKSEVNYISKRFKIPVGVVRIAIREVGISRVKIYARLRELGYVINTRKK